MEDKTEKMLGILETWMNYKGIPKHEQITYYKKVISMLEEKENNLKYIILSSSISSLGIGFGLGNLLMDNNDINISLGILFILFVGIVALPIKKEKKYLKGYEEIEEKRELIKKWWQEKKN